MFHLTLLNRILRVGGRHPRRVVPKTTPNSTLPPRFIPDVRNPGSLLTNKVGARDVSLSQHGVLLAVSSRPQQLIFDWM